METKGYKTPSFWLIFVATALSALFASNVVPDASALTQGVSFAIMALGSVGYASARAFAKGTSDKPAWKTTEFWLSLAAFVVGALTASGIFPAESTAMKIVGGIASLLVLAGYQARFSLQPKA